MFLRTTRSKVAQLRDETFTYSVNVPQAVTEQRVRTVTNAVPVTRTRTIKFVFRRRPCKRSPKTTVIGKIKSWKCLPRVAGWLATEPVAHASGGCGLLVTMVDDIAVVAVGAVLRHVRRAAVTAVALWFRWMRAGGGCTSTASKRVWVPNCVTETVPVTTSSTECQTVHYTVYEQQSTQVPYECTKVVYNASNVPEPSSAVTYVDETRTRMRKVVKYNDGKTDSDA